MRNHYVHNIRLMIIYLFAMSRSCLFVHESSQWSKGMAIHPKHLVACLVEPTEFKTQSKIQKFKNGKWQRLKKREKQRERKTEKHTAQYTSQKRVQREKMTETHYRILLLKFLFSHLYFCDSGSAMFSKFKESLNFSEFFFCLHCFFGSKSKVRLWEFEELYFVVVYNQSFEVSVEQWLIRVYRTGV